MNQHREQLMDYLYDELQPGQARAFEEHLSGCPVCQKDLEDFRVVKHALASWQLEGVPRITLSVSPKPRRRWLELFGSLPWSLRLAGVAASVVILMALANFRVGYNAVDGFQLSTSLLPRPTPAPAAVPLSRPDALSDQEIRSLIAAAVQEVEHDRDRGVASRLEALADQLRSEQRQSLITLAKTLRQEQETRLSVATQQGQTSYTTLSALFTGDTGDSY